LLDFFYNKYIVSTRTFLIFVAVAMTYPHPIQSQNNASNPVWKANVMNSSQVKLKCEVTDNSHWHDTYGVNSACVYSEGTVDPGNTLNFSLPLSSCAVLQDPAPPHLVITPDPTNIGIVCYADDNAYVHTNCFQMMAKVESGSTVTLTCPAVQ